MQIYERIRLMPDDQDLAQWKSAWDLQDLPSPHVRCRACAAMQTAHDRHIGFEHKQDCDAFYTYGQFPWRDLMWIFENIDTNAR